MVEQSSILKHGTRDVEQPVDDRAKGARVAMAPCSQSLVFSLTDRIVLNCDGAPVEDGVSQTSIAGAATRNDAALATSPRHRCSAIQTAQSMIVSTLQSIW